MRETVTTTAETTAGPVAPWLAAGLLLAGLGTVLLGPILPAVSHNWHLTDAQTGPLFFAKFVGSFIGGVSVPRRLRLGILSGTLLGCLGFAAFGLCDSLVPGALALFVAGIGLGQIIASTNVLAGNRYRRHTGSALASLNFFFSLGAVVTGVIIAELMPRLGLRDLLLWVGAAFLAAGFGGRLATLKPSSLNPSSLIPEQESSALKTSSLIALENPQQLTPTTSLPRNLFLIFCTLLFLYGGLETCLVGWLTTFTQRYSTDHLLGSQSAIVLLLAAATAGRALSSVALRYAREISIQRIGLASSFLCIVALTATRHAASLSLCAILLGLSLAPFFPSTFGILMRRSPPARTAGFILAVSGLGAAIFPPLMGFVSTRTGSLRLAMAVPMALALLLLAFSFLIPEQNPEATSV